MGFDNLGWRRASVLPLLTTIQLPHDIIGREAALYIIEGREGEGTRIPCPLLIRCSTWILCYPSCQSAPCCSNFILRGRHRATVPVLLAAG